MAGAVFGEVELSLLVAGAVFSEVQMSLSLAGAIFGEVQVPLFVAGAVSAEVELSLFVAGAVCREIWNDSRSAKRCIFQYKMLLVSAKSKLLTARVHGRIILGTVSDRSRIVNDVSARFSCFHQISVTFWTVILRARGSIW